MSSDALNPNVKSDLDNTRLDKGIDGLKSCWRKLVRSDIRKAIELINDEKLCFCSLYALMPEIRRYGMIPLLSGRNRKAVEISNGIALKNRASIERLTNNRNNSTFHVLKWMLETGCADDGLDNRYDEIMELSAVLLTKCYKDSSLLQLIIDMTFNRYRKGFLIHHLVWAFFEARTPKSMNFIANYILSSEPKDYELACKLLNFIPYIEARDSSDRISQYYNTIQWIEENHPFLHYTGESLHQTSKPQPYTISREGKYLCKPVMTDEKRLSDSLGEDEKNLLADFKELGTKTRILLSDCSYQLYRRSFNSWNIWIHYPVDEQIKTAKLMMGGFA
jgi:hypothetical protein